MSEPTSRHYWTITERKALLILVDEYHLAWNVLTPLFNSWLGQPHGLLQQVLYSQYIYVAHTPSKLRQRKVQDALVETHNDVENIRDQLKQTATKLGIRLAKPDQIEDSEIQHHTSIKRKRSLSEIHTPKANRLYGVDCDPTHDQPCTPKHYYGLKTPPTSRIARQKPIQTESSLQESPTLAIPSVQRGPSNAVVTKPKGTLSPANTMPHMPLPLIGFRGYSKEKSQGLNSPSGFRAGVFVNSARIPQCPAVTDPSFIAEATFHVGWTKGHPSPFISVTESCIRAIMKSRSPESGRYLAVLDLHKSGRSGEIFSAKSLDLKPSKPNGAPIKYHSGGEYLIWGAINRDAIISVVSIESLISPPPAVFGDCDPLELAFISTAWRRVAIRCVIAKNGKMSLSYQAGIAVGEFVRRLRVTPDYNEAVTSLIVSDWQFDTKKGELWQDNSIFCQGLDLSLAKANQIQHADTSNHISQAGFMEHDIYQEDSDDYRSLLEQLELATSESPDESGDELVHVEHRKEMALTSSGRDDRNRGSTRGTGAEARAASEESTAFTDQEDLTMVSAASSSSASQKIERPSAEDEYAWPAWTGM